MTKYKLTEKISFQRKLKQTIKTYNQMKNSVFNYQHEEADKFLEDFKNKNKEMLSNKELTKEFVNVSVSRNNSKRSTR